MAQELVLHVGTMKSGTTYLQNILAQNRRVLSELGWRYPGKRLNQQHAVYGLCGSEVPWIAEPSSVMKNLGQRLVDQVRHTDKDVILSSEALATLKEEAITDFLKLVGSPTKIVFTVRPLWKLIPSAWQQYVKSGGTLDLRHYIARQFQEAWDPEVASGTWRTYAYGKAIKRWANVCSVEVIEILPHKGAHTELWHAFRTVTGIPEVQDLDVAAADGNPSLQLESAEILRRVNDLLHNQKNRAQLRRFYLRNVLLPLAGEALGERPRLPADLMQTVNDWNTAETRIMLDAAARVVTIGDVAGRQARPHDCDTNAPRSNDAAICEVASEHVARLLITTVGT